MRCPRGGSQPPPGRYAEQEQALQGKQGAILLLVNAKDGETKKTMKLPSLPIWDSLAVARENVYYTNQKGEVICLGE